MKVGRPGFLCLFTPLSSVNLGASSKESHQNTASSVPGGSCNDHHCTVQEIDTLATLPVSADLSQAPGRDEFRCNTVLGQSVPDVPVQDSIDISLLTSFPWPETEISNLDGFSSFYG